MGNVFKSDIFDWARDLAIIQRIFGNTGHGSLPADSVAIRTIRPAAGPERDQEVPNPTLVELEESRKS